MCGDRQTQRAVALVRPSLIARAGCFWDFAAKPRPPLGGYATLLKWSAEFSLSGWFNVALQRACALSARLGAAAFGGSGPAGARYKLRFVPSQQVNGCQPEKCKKTDHIRHGGDKH